MTTLGDPWSLAYSTGHPGGSDLDLCTADGGALSVQTDRWHGTATPGERRLLARVRPPVLDIGCGPGRLVSALAHRGVEALGVDTSAAATRRAREGGATAINRSVFARLPAEGEWAAALLLDGNIGIGGDPATLLERVRSLLAPRGEVFVEAVGPGRPLRRRTVRLVRAARAGPWFEWAEVDPEGVTALGRRVGLVPVEVWEDEGRWFVQLRRPASG